MDPLGPTTTAALLTSRGIATKYNIRTKCQQNAEMFVVTEARDRLEWNHQPRSFDVLSYIFQICGEETGGKGNGSRQASVFLPQASLTYSGPVLAKAREALHYWKMWAPIDVNAIPSPEDVLNATNTIGQIENLLKEALISLEQARLRVADLEKELQQRRAWLSPIRRLNFDVLCRVFEFTGEDDWKTPLRVASVSHSWRSIVLRTPRAWSFFSLRRKQDPKLIDLYLERSGQRLLHIGISRYTSFLTLTPMKDRLRCLSVYTFQPHIDGIVFPNVTKLHIRHTDARVFPTSVTREYFPALMHLHCQSQFIHEPAHGLMDDTGFTYDLPPLETLWLRVSADTTCVSFLRSCSKTLTSLRLEVRGGVTGSGQRHSITMPLLKCLQVSGRIVHSTTWPLNLKTPVLDSYISHVWHSSTDRLIHSDLETVTQMRLSGVRQLNNCSSLRYLQILNGWAVLYPILTMLEGNTTLCPELEVIIVTVEAKLSFDEAEFAQRVEEVRVGRAGLKVLREYGTVERLKGEMNLCCGENMPCN